MSDLDFDWQNETSLKGTVSRLGRYVRGQCEVDGCPEDDALLYDSWDDSTLMCAPHSRRRAKDVKHVERCDKCGRENAWRDPLSGKNEFFCAQCHAENGTVFQNRWADRARVGRVLGLRERVKCEAAGYGSDCKGEIKYRSAQKMTLCNGHAGKKSAGPEWHQ